MVMTWHVLFCFLLQSSADESLMQVAQSNDVHLKQYKAMSDVPWEMHLKAMEPVLLQAAKGGKLNNVTKEAINAILNLTADIETEINATHDNDKAELVTAKAAVTGCNNDANVVTKIVSFSTEVPKLEKAHSALRTTELGAKQGTLSSCEIYKADSLKVPEIPTTCHGQSPLTFPTDYPLKSGIKGGWFDSTGCNMASHVDALVTAKKSLLTCTDKRDSYATAIGNSKAAQLAFEVAACQWHTESYTICKTLDSCYARTAGALANTCDRVANNVAARKKHLAAVEKFECLGKSLLDGTSIDKCADLTVADTHLDIACPSVDKKWCGTIPAPGSQEFTQLHYTNASWISEATNDLSTQTSILDSVQQCNQQPGGPTTTSSTTTAAPSSPLTLNLVTNFHSCSAGRTEACVADPSQFALDGWNMVLDYEDDWCQQDLPHTAAETRDGFQTSNAAFIGLDALSALESKGFLESKVKVCFFSSTEGCQGYCEHIYNDEYQVRSTCQSVHDKLQTTQGRIAAFLAGACADGGNYASIIHPKQCGNREANDRKHASPGGCTPTWDHYTTGHEMIWDKEACGIALYNATRGARNGLGGDGSKEFGYVSCSSSPQFQDKVFYRKTDTLQVFVK